MQGSYIKQGQAQTHPSASVATPQEILIKITVLAALYLSRPFVEGWVWWAVLCVVGMTMAVAVLIKLLKARR